MKSSAAYLVLFALVVCGVVYLSIPSENTLVEMSRDDTDIERTRQLLLRRVEREPDNVQAALELTDFYIERLDDDEALRALRNIHEQVPGDALVRTRLGIALLRRGGLDEAFSVVPEADRSRDFWLLASQKYEELGDLGGAEKALLKADAGGPENAQTWKRIARWRWDMYDMDGAADALRRALAVRPDDVEALESFFTNRVWQLDAPESIKIAERLDAAGALDRTHLTPLYGMQMAVRDMDGAADTLQKIAALPDAEPADMFALGIFLYQKGDIAKSDAVFLDLASVRDLPDGLLEDTVDRLEYSAVQNKNLDLAERLVGLTDSPQIEEGSRITVIDVAIETGRFDVAVQYARPLLENPEASAEVIETGLTLAYRTDSFAELPELHTRLASAGVSIDDLANSMPEDDKTLDEWGGALASPYGKAYALAGWLKTAMRLNSLAEETPGSAERVPLAEMARMADALLPLADERAILIAAVLVDALSDLAEAAPNEPERRKRLEQAAAWIDRIGDGELARSAAFMMRAAGVNELLDRGEAAEKYWQAAAKASADDPWSRLGLARAAARRGDPRAVEEAIRHSEGRGAERSAAEIRGLVDSCLALVDALREENPLESERWLVRAKELVANNAAILSGPEIENIILRADVAERSGDMVEALASWEGIAEREPARLAAWLGVARAASALERHDRAWEALLRAEALTGEADTESRMQLAWQMMAVADSVPEDDPDRLVRQERALAYAEDSLSRRWDPDLSQSLFWRMLEKGELEKAARYAHQQRNAPEIRAALAEAFLAADRRDEASREAVAALKSEDRAVLLRMVYVLVQLEQKEKARETLARVEKAKGEETQDFLLQLADAYGAVEEYDRQYALVERRARAGGEKEWLDAVDRHTWAGDNAGAVALLAEARDVLPGSVALVDRQLSLLVDDNRPGEALDAFTLARSGIDALEEKLSGDALAALGVASDDLRATPRARRFFRLSLDKEQDNKRGCMGYARLLRRDGNLAGAILQLRRYVAATADDPWGWLELANTRALADQNGRSEYRKVIALTEPDAKGEIPRDVRAARAVALRSLGREKEALRLLRGTMGPKIDNPDIACDYAQMLMDIQQYEEAEQILRDTVKVFPYHVWAYRLEATILVRRQKYDLAVARLKEALVWSPRDGEVQRDLGYAAQLWERTWDSQKGWLTAGGR